MNSRQKGKRGELELAALLREHGFPEARRGVQYQGGADSPDCIGLPDVHIEVKRTEKTALYDWIEQADGERPLGSIPAIFHRKNGRRRWLTIVYADDFLDLLHLAEHGKHGKAA